MSLWAFETGKKEGRKANRPAFSRHPKHLITSPKKITSDSHQGYLSYQKRKEILDKVKKEQKTNRMQTILLLAVSAACALVLLTAVIKLYAWFG